MSSDRKLPQGTRSQDLRFIIEIERETDGRWIAEISQVPGALAYGKTREEAVNKAYAIALRSVADDVEQSKDEPPNSISVERNIAWASGQALRPAAYSRRFSKSVGRIFVKLAPTKNLAIRISPITLGLSMMAMN
jgi:predicted RNase H-like HicB family nuclease